MDHFEYLSSFFQLELGYCFDHHEIFLLLLMLELIDLNVSNDDSHNVNQELGFFYLFSELDYVE